VAWSVAVGLAVGKPAGILLFCWLGTQMRWTALPEGVTWPMLAGGACLAGIGFTMALFLNGLAFATMEHQAAMVAGKVGTLLGSLVSAVFGAILLTWALPRPSPSLNSGST
jgi:NhaA family Na+:H+ antiporter